MVDVLLKSIIGQSIFLLNFFLQNLPAEPQAHLPFGTESIICRGQSVNSIRYLPHSRLANLLQLCGIDACVRFVCM